jgi:hypothetical protein
MGDREKVGHLKIGFDIWGLAPANSQTRYRDPISGIRRIEDSANTVRAWTSFPPDLYGTLEQIGQQKKVSLASIVRDAAEKYVTEFLEDGESNIKNMSKHFCHG